MKNHIADTGKMASKKWSEADVQFAIDNYKTKTTREIAAMLGRTFLGTKLKMVKILKLILTPEEREERRRTTYWKPGHVTWNKGLKGICAPGSEKGQFKKGNIPHNTKYDNCISIRHDHINRRGGRKYYYIRISKAKWRPLHQHIWEAAYGKIPKGHTLMFLNGNSLDVRLDNLTCIPRSVQVALNGHEGLSDGYVAALMTHKNKPLREYIKKHKPELIEAKRIQIKLHKELKNVTKKAG